MSKIKVAVVGIGNIGCHHARIYSEMPQVDLVGVVDVDVERGKYYAGRLQTKFYKDYKILFDKVQAVNIAVPTYLHHSMAMDFLNHKVNVFVEKPITVDLYQARDLVGLAKKNNLVLQVGHLERFNPAVKELKHLVEKPIFIETQRISFPTQRNLDVGVVWDLMIHDLDILINLVDSPIEDIQGIGLRIYSDFEDFAQVKIIFKNGCLASLLASRISGEKLRRLKIIEEVKTVSLDFVNQTVTVMRPPQDGKPNTFEHIYVEKEEPLKLELEHFIECIKKHKKPLVAGEDGKRALELAMLITNSMKIINKSKEQARKYLSVVK